MDDIVEALAQFVGLVVRLASWGLAIAAAGWIVVHAVRFISS